MDSQAQAPRDNGAPSVEAQQPGDSDDPLGDLLVRLRREPALRQWVLTAPTGALASLGIALDDTEVVALLEQVEAMDERPVPVTAADVMTTDLTTVHPDTTTHEAASMMAERRISGVPVCDTEGNLVGVLSEFDLIARSGRVVRDVMTREVVSVPATATVDHVRAVLVSQRLKRVPVLDERGHLAGLISRADLVREFAYRWACARCGNTVRSRRPPEHCSRCGATGRFEAATLPAAVRACPTCGRPIDAET